MDTVRSRTVIAGFLRGTSLLRHGDLKPLLGRDQMIVIVGGGAGVEFHPVDLSREFGAMIARIVGRHRRSGFVADVQGFLAKCERFGLLEATLSCSRAVNEE